MKNRFVAAIALTSVAALSACSGGTTLTPEQCEAAQEGIAKATAAIVIYQDQYPDREVPEGLFEALETANALKPLLCPTPTTVVVQQ